MNRRSGTVVAGGVVVALLGMLLVFVYAGQVRSGAGVSSGAGAVFVATTDIPVGSRFEDVSASLKKKDVPSDVLPATAVTAEEQLAGKSSVQSIAKGEIITSTQFNTSSSGGLDIPPGTNAVTINLGIPQGVARYVQPGADANVYVTYKDRPDVNDASEATITQLVLSNVKVLANRPAVLNPSQEQAQEAGQTAEILLTVAVTPDQAEKLIFAKENGSVWLGLVNPGDAPVASGGRTFSSALI